MVGWDYFKSNSALKKHAYLFSVFLHILLCSLEDFLALRLRLGLSLHIHHGEFGNKVWNSNYRDGFWDKIV